jgi:cell division protein FtsB
VTRPRVLAAALALGAAAVLGGWGLSAALRVQALRAEIAAAQEEIVTLRARAERLAEAIRRLRDDPAYVEKIAREEHGMVREDETVLKFPPRSP